MAYFSSLARFLMSFCAALMAIFAVFAPVSAYADEGEAPICHDIIAWEGNRPNDVPPKYVYHDGNGIADRAQMADIIAKSQAVLRKGGKTIIEGGDFSGWDFAGAMGEGVCFLRTNLSHSNWENADMRNSGFIASDLSGSNLSAATFIGIVLHNVDLANAQAEHVNFSHGQYSAGWFDASVAGLSLNYANLQYFVFSCGIVIDDGCPVYQGDAPASLKGANLRYGELSDLAHSAMGYNLDFTDAILGDNLIAPSLLILFEAADIIAPLHFHSRYASSLDISLSPDEARMLIAEHHKWKDAQEQASFDCAKAGTAVEKAICINPEIMAQDRKMAALYRMAVQKQGAKAKNAQRQWLKKRNDCAKDFSEDDEHIYCLYDEYEAQNIRLSAMAYDKDWLKIGETATFIDDSLPVLDEFRTSPLYRKLAMVFKLESRAEITITRKEDVNGDAVYAASGEAVGANAHLCSLDADALMINRNSGWYQQRNDKGEKLNILAILGDELHVIGNGHPENHDIGDYVSCGARAGFDSLRRSE